jgi:hypothetical protein
MREMAGVGGGVVNGLQELKAHLLEVLVRGGDDWRGRSHGGRGGGGGALVSEGVPGEEKGQARA